MVILGVDTGLRHTGYAVLVGKRLVEKGTLVPENGGKHANHDWLRMVGPMFLALMKQRKPDVVVIEEVVWYGKAKKVLLPLSHSAGMLVGICLASGVPSYLVAPNMKSQIDNFPKRKGWDEHQRDAYRLALTFLREPNKIKDRLIGGSPS